MCRPQLIRDVVRQPAPMPIPKTRSELTELGSTSHAKLERELRLVGPAAAERRCVDSWSVKDLIAVRAWWTEQVVDWIDAGGSESFAVASDWMRDPV